MFPLRYSHIVGTDHVILYKLEALLQSHTVTRFFFLRSVLFIFLLMKVAKTHNSPNQLICIVNILLF